MKKIFNFIIGAIVVFIVLAMFLPEDIVNKGEQTYTLMVYVNGSDLETDGGYATTDIEEMLYATIDEKVNVVIQTGGTGQWQNYDIQNNERYTIEDGSLVLLEDDFAEHDMLTPEALTNFIEFSKENYEADRYALIMWNHGGGAISGFGYDETVEGEDTLTIDEIGEALDNTDILFDFVGFDACLMATIETAYMLNGNAKYLVASEELEPGTGWNYTDILNTLSANTDIDTVEFGKAIADSFIESNTGLLWDEEATLSVIDVENIDILLNTLTDYMKEVDITLLQTQEFNTVAKAINDTKAFGYGELDTIDLYHLVENLPNSHSDKLLEELKSAIVYNTTTSVMENSNGLSIYIPYSDLDYYAKMSTIYSNLGLNEGYVSVLDNIANTVAGGMRPTRNVTGDVVDTNDYSEEEWYDSSYIDSNNELYSEYSYEDLEITDAGEYYILELTDEDWDVISSISSEVFYDDGEGYIELGSDNYYETTEDGDLIVSFDGTWISLDGQTVPFYVIEETDKLIKAVVPAYLNDELVELVIVWDDKNPDGAVIGARAVNDYGDETIQNRGLIEIKKGDAIEFVFDYYTYDGEYDNSYIIGDALTVGKNDIKVEYSEVGDNEFYVYYKITDIYGNEYYTEAVILY